MLNFVYITNIIDNDDPDYYATGDDMVTGIARLRLSTVPKHNPMRK